MQCDEERLFLLLTSNYDTRVRPGASLNFQVSAKKSTQSRKIIFSIAVFHCKMNPDNFLIDLF